MVTRIRPLVADDAERLAELVQRSREFLEPWELVGLAFGDLGLHRVEAGTVPHNLASQAVLRRNGFEQFGYAPRYLAIAGAYADHLLFQRLAD